MNELINIPEYKVSQFNRLFRDVIETNFSYVRIKGEISEIKRATRGQLYLTIKDDESILSGVIWDNKKRNLQFNPESGMEVVVTGKITTWGVVGLSILGLIIAGLFIFYGGWLGADHFSRAAQFHKMAEKAHGQGKTKKAQRLYKKAEILRRKSRNKII